MSPEDKLYQQKMLKEAYEYDPQSAYQLGSGEFGFFNEKLGRYVRPHEVPDAQELEDITRMNQATKGQFDKLDDQRKIHMILEMDRIKKELGIKSTDLSI